MQYISAEEKQRLDDKLRSLNEKKVEVQGRITTAAALGDLSENAEYHFAKEENRNLEKELSDLQAKLQNVAVVDGEELPEDMVFLGQTVKLLDTDLDDEELVRIVGEVEGSEEDDEEDVMTVSSSSPLGEALMKRRVGETVTVEGPRRSMTYKIMEIMPAA
jgi:transcription elongation factor GreA